MAWFPAGPTAAARYRARPVVELLEDRLVLNAGDLDPTFGVGGQVITDMTHNGRLFALAAQPDGMIVAGGSTFTEQGALALARYDLAGNLDPMFGVEGKVVDVRFGSTTIRALGLQSNGAIVATGHGTYSDGDLVLVRYDSTGTLDPTFGNNGTVTVDLDEGSVSMFDLAVMPDDRIVVAGALRVGGGGWHHVFVARYLAGGTPDPSFSDDGMVFNEVNGAGGYATRIHVHADGSILVAGIPPAPTNTYDVLLARYLVDGTPDPDFGEEGLVQTQVHDKTVDIRDLAILPDGAILAVGAAYGFSNHTDIAILRYLPDGQLDTDFGTAGLLQMDFGGTTEAAETLIDLGDGKYILAGHFSPGGTGKFYLGRLTADMQPDPEFGVDGWVFTDFDPGDNEGINAFLATPDGRLVAGGNNSNNFVLAAYQNFPEASFPPEEGSFARSALAGGNEGTKNVELLVELSRPTIRKAKVGYTVIGGTAKRDRDYTLADGKVKFLPGQTQQVIKLTVRDDHKVESDETIIIKLTNPRNAALASDAVVTYTIVDNDSAERQALAGGSVDVGEGETLLLSVPSKIKQSGDAEVADERNRRSAAEVSPDDAPSRMRSEELPERRGAEEVPVVRKRVSPAMLEMLVSGDVVAVS